MGRKFRELKERLKNNPSRALVVIDDREIRLRAFTEAERWIRKIETLSDKIASFHSRDQMLFDRWFDLTFRADREHLNVLQEQLRDLTRFHNWMVTEAKRRDISMPEAYIWVKREEEAYAKGTEKERDEIDRIRADRDEYARRAIEEEYREAFGPKFGERVEDQDEFSPFRDDPEEDPEEPRSKAGPSLADLDPRSRREWEERESMSDSEIKEQFEDREGALTFLFRALDLGTEAGDISFFLRPWDLAPDRVRREFRKLFRAFTGEKLEDVLADLAAEADEEENLHSERFGDFDAREDEYDAFLGRRRPGRPAPLTPAQGETLKLTYRKLVRILHPDVRGGGLVNRMTTWMNEMWDRVQKHYKEGDIRGLEQIHRLTLLYTKNLNSLTLSEIEEGTEELEHDWRALEAQSKSLQRMLAWNFSKKKDLAPLERKVRKSMEPSRISLLEQIGEIQEQHQRLEAWVHSTSSHQSARRRSRSGTSAGRKANGRGRSARAQTRRRHARFSETPSEGHSDIRR
jgi:hypothetical protein